MAKRIKIGNISSQDRKLTVCLWIPTITIWHGERKGILLLARNEYGAEAIPFETTIVHVQFTWIDVNVKLCWWLSSGTCIYFPIIWQPLFMEWIQPTKRKYRHKCGVGRHTIKWHKFRMAIQWNPYPMLVNQK